jgi:hypothetical protein
VDELEPVRMGGVHEAVIDVLGAGHPAPFQQFAQRLAGKRDHQQLHKYRKDANAPRFADVRLAEKLGQPKVPGKLQNCFAAALLFDAVL